MERVIVEIEEELDPLPSIKASRHAPSLPCWKFVRVLLAGSLGYGRSRC